MRTVPKVLAGLCAVALSATVHAAYVSVVGTDLSIVYDPLVFQTPGTSVFDSSAFQMYARSEGSGEAVEVRSETSFMFKLTDPNVHLLGLTLMQSGQYALSGNQSLVGARSAIDVEGTGARDARAQSTASGGPFNLRDGVLHVWSTSQSVSLTGGAWSGARALRITERSVVDAYAPAASGDFAFVTLHTGALDASTEVSGSGTAGGSGAGTVGGGGQIATTPIPASGLLLASGLLALTLWGRRRTPLD
jgi:hypothetical protein